MKLWQLLVFQVTGSRPGPQEGQRKETTKIYSQKCNAKLQISKPENQTLQPKSSVLPVRMPTGLPGQAKVCSCSLAWGWLWTASLLPSLRSLTPLEHAPTVLCPQGDSVVAAAHGIHRKASDDLTFAVTPAECGVLSPA